MERTQIRQRVTEFALKYRYILLVLLAGLLLMMLPDSKKEATVVSPAEAQIPQESLQEQLQEILGRIKGAGKVQVLLTQYRGEETVFQSDTDRTGDALRSETVMLSRSDRSESGLVRQVNPPVYQGALIVCQGGDIPTVKLAIVEAVMSVTGLRSTEITVLKMK
ncbi:MAG: hypothetical protein IJA75_01295 [Oscillospiraceae bacterium]|nr:hypothetical protein [Oscillospiraceae bacterium]